MRGCEHARTALVRARGLAAGVGFGKTVSDADFWAGQTETALRCLLHAAALDGRGPVDLYRWSLNPVLAEEAVHVLNRASTPPSGWADALDAIVHSDPRTRDSVWLGVRQSLAALADPRVLPRSTPGRARLPSGGVPATAGTLYLLASAVASASSAPLVAAFVEDITETARRLAARSPGARLDPPLLLALDEIANLTPLPSLPSLMAEGGGSGITTVTVFQSLAQARHRWGEHAADASGTPPPSRSSSAAWPSCATSRTSPGCSARSTSPPTPSRADAAETGRPRSACGRCPSCRRPCCAPSRSGRPSCCCATPARCHRPAAVDDAARRRRAGRGPGRGRGPDPPADAMKILLGVGAAVAGRCACPPSRCSLSSPSAAPRWPAPPPPVSARTPRWPASAPVPDRARAWIALTHTACPDLPDAVDRRGHGPGVLVPTRRVRPTTATAAPAACSSSTPQSGAPPTAPAGTPTSTTTASPTATTPRSTPPPPAATSAAGWTASATSAPPTPTGLSSGSGADLDALVIAHNAGEAWLPRYPTLPEVTEAFLTQRRPTRHRLVASQPARRRRSGPWPAALQMAAHQRTQR